MLLSAIISIFFFCLNYTLNRKVRLFSIKSLELQRTSYWFIKSENFILPIGKYDGMTAFAHDEMKLNASSCDGESISSKNIPPTPRHSPRCGIRKYLSHHFLNLKFKMNWNYIKLVQNWYLKWFF